MEFKRIFLFVTIILAMTLTAQVPRTMNYQGKLTDGSGIAVHAPSGIAVTFRIYDVSSGGTALWTEAHASVPVTNGLFDVILGETTPMTIDFDEQYWIELTVGGEPLTPREQLAAVPYAHRAVYSDTALVIGSGAVQTTARLDGDGTTGDPLDIAQQGAINGQVLKWNGTSWAPSADATGGSGTVTSIATNNGITGGTITTTGTVGLTGQALALHNLSTNGLIARTGSGTVAGRTITGSTGISVSNGNGVSGNPTITNIAPWTSSSNDYIQNQTAADQTAGFRITGDGLFNGGKVGIGTSTPTYRLEIVPNNDDRGLSIYHEKTSSGNAYGIHNTLYNNYGGNAVGYGALIDIRNNTSYLNNSNQYGIWTKVRDYGSGEAYGYYANSRKYGSPPTGINYGFYSLTSYGSSVYGVYASATDGSTNYGIYATASGGTTNWAGYFEGNVHASGNVGIGTTSPAAQLHTTGTVRFAGAGTPGAGKVLTSDASGTATWQNVSGAISDGTTNDATLRWNGSNWVENVNVLTSNGSGTGYLTVGNPSGTSLYIRAGDTGSPCIIGQGTGDLSITSAEDIVLDPANNVGIGTIDPDMTLDVRSTIGVATADESQFLNLSAVPTGQRIRFSNASHLEFGAGAGYGGLGSYSEIMRIDGVNRRVGIGTTAPASKLEIYGGDLYVHGSDNAGLRIGEGAAYYEMLVDYDVNDEGTSLFFQANGTDRVVFQNSGNVGIGTTSPAAKLEVANGDALIYGITVGRGAGAVSTNTVVGSDALSSNTTGQLNTAIGYRSQQSNLSTQENTSLGGHALMNNRADRNTAVGAYSLSANTSGTRNSALGHSALTANTTANDNTAVGYYALANNIVGIDNTAVGSRSLESNTNNGNTAVGSCALTNNTVGSYNTAVGYYTLAKNRFGVYNSALGSYALLNLDPPSAAPQGFYNSAVGYKALQSLSTGYGNTAMGYYAGEAVTALTTGYYNTGIGYQASFDANNRINTIVLAGNGNLSLGGNNRVRVGNSSMTSIGGQVGWTALSDERIKTNVEEDVPGLAFITKLRPVTYSFDIDKQDELMWGAKNESDWEGKYDIESIRFSGFIAQEVEKAAKSINYSFSGIDKPDGDGLYGLRYAEFVVPLVKAVQELTAENAELRSEIERLKALEARIEALENNQ